MKVWTICHAVGMPHLLAFGAPWVACGRFIPEFLRYFHFRGRAFLSFKIGGFINSVLPLPSPPSVLRSVPLNQPHPSQPFLGHMHDHLAAKLFGKVANITLLVSLRRSVHRLYLTSALWD